MTVQQKSFFKNNILTLANILVLLGFIIQQSKWQQIVDNKIELYDSHMVNETKHMPFEKKIQIFVPRVEIDMRLKNIERSLVKIENAVK